MFSDFTSGSQYTHDLPWGGQCFQILPEVVSILITYPEVVSVFRLYLR